MSTFEDHNPPLALLMVQKSLETVDMEFSHFSADLHISQLVRDHQQAKRPTTFVNPATPIQAGQMKMALSSMSRMRSPNLGSVPVFSRYQV